MFSTHLGLVLTLILFFPIPYAHLACFDLDEKQALEKDDADS